MYVVLTHSLLNVQKRAFLVINDIEGPYLSFATGGRRSMGPVWRRAVQTRRSLDAPERLQQDPASYRHLGPPLSCTILGRLLDHASSSLDIPFFLQVICHGMPCPGESHRKRLNETFC